MKNSEEIKENILGALKKYDAIMSGDWTLSSGYKSNWYVNVKRILGRPEIREQIVDYFEDSMAINAEYVAGNGVGGTIVATDISTKYGLGLTAIRNERKSYGTMQTVEGEPIRIGGRYVFADDVISTGGSLSKMTDSVKSEGAEVLGYYTVVDRSEEKPEWEGVVRNLGVPVHSILTSRDLGILK